MPVAKGQIRQIIADCSGTEKHRKAFGEHVEEVAADGGYCSERNLLFLKEDGITSYIKFQNHEKRKTHVYKEDMGKYYNMKRDVSGDEDYYVCYDGRLLYYILLRFQ